MRHTDRYREALKRGVWAFVALAVLTVIEYFVAVSMRSGAFGWLFIIMLLKTGVIAHTFMHILQLWRAEE